MENTPLCNVNNYYRLADLAAIAFIREQKRLIELQQRLLNHQHKYENVLAKHAGNNFTNMLAVPSHLAAAVIEGIVLAPLFYFYLEGMIESSVIHEAASYFPIAIFCGITLVIGKIFHEFYWKKDRINPQKADINFGSLANGIILSVAYLFLLFQLTEAARGLLDGQEDIAVIIFCIGAAELILGYFSIPGWEAFYVYLAQYSLRTQVSRSIKMIQKFSHQCDQNYTYYEQSLFFFNIVEGQNYTPKINMRIELALSFCYPQNKNSTGSKMDQIRIDPVRNVV